MCAIVLSLLLFVQGVTIVVIFNWQRAQILQSAFIGGEWEGVELSFETINPATGDVITDVANCSYDHVDRAVKAAKMTLCGPTWGYSSTSSTRIAFLRSLALIMDRDREHLAALDSLDEGKPLRESRADVSDAISLANHLADILQESSTEAPITIDNGTEEFTTRVFHEPVGVVAAITPWNYPFLMGAYKVLPALAAGCTVVLKPSELAPLSCLVLAELCKEAGLPAGALNVLPGLGSVTGDLLARHPDIDKISFTGSLPTAQKVMAAAALGPRALSLELGGKSPAIVFEDANLDSAADWLVTGFMWGSGQVCSATSRLLVHSSVADALVSKIIDKLKGVRLGDSLAEDIAACTKPTMGPVVSRNQFDKVWGYIDEAHAEGTQCCYGGTRQYQGMPARGFFVPPTIFLNPSPSSRAWREEIFGPVLCVIEFTSEEDAVEKANATVYGLAGAVFSADPQRCERVAKALRVGVMWLNCSQPAFIQAPWGGCKSSGFGRELGKWGIDEFTHVKQVTSCEDGYSWGLW